MILHSFVELQPVNVNADDGQQKEEAATAITYLTSAFMKYTTCVLKKIDDQQVAIDAKRAPRIWIPTLVPL